MSWWNLTALREGKMETISANATQIRGSSARGSAGNGKVTPHAAPASLRVNDNGEVGDGKPVPSSNDGSARQENIS